MKYYLLTTVCFLTTLGLSAQKMYDVVISEIMADPGSGNPEWVELYNRTDQAINIGNWIFGDAGTETAAFPSYDLPANSYLILCSSSDRGSFPAGTPVLGLSRFPSLNNKLDQLFLYDVNRDIVHTLIYRDSYYQNQNKAGGGWSLEMIDPGQPCRVEDNWKASEAATQSSPGKPNSVAGTLVQSKAKFIRLFCPDSLTVRLVFDRQLADPLAWTDFDYVLTPTTGASILGTDQTLFTELEMQTEKPLQTATQYRLQVNGVADGCGVRLDPIDQTFLMPSTAAAGDILINEILFDPYPDASDFVELYNNSRKAIDLQTLFLANRKNAAELSGPTPISAGPDYLNPGQYALISTDTLALRFHYVLKDQTALRQVAKLPSLPNDAGSCVLINSNGAIIDELQYHGDWHFALLQKSEGVSLERLDLSRQTQDPGNWHSAGSSAGGATPGYVNSQFRPDNSVGARLTVSPKVISPDNDGRDDFAELNFNSSRAGYMGNLIIYSVGLLPVRYLAKSQVLSQQNYWTWDGLDEQRRPLPTGQYIATLEIFNLDGKREMMKEVVVLR